MYNIHMDFVGIDKLSLLDYVDKVSCVLFCKPCNFRCPFCHNGLTVLNAEEEIPFSEILDFLKQRAGFIDAVVITGGEPTLMPDLEDKIRQIKALGYLIKLDTNGTNPDLLAKLVYSKLVDYVAMDVKNSLTRYPETTNTTFVHYNNIVRSINILKDGGVDYEFRTTLVKEFHDMNSICDMANLLRGAKTLYLQKFVSREGCFKKDLHPVDEDLANEFKRILSLDVKEVYLRGY